MQIFYYKFLENDKTVNKNINNIFYFEYKFNYLLLIGLT